MGGGAIAKDFGKNVAQENSDAMAFWGEFPDDNGDLAGHL